MFLVLLGKPSILRRNKMRFRSKFEKSVYQKLKSKNRNIKYEDLTLDYIIPASTHKYLPDFIDYKNKILYEAKGIFSIIDRKKMILIQNQYPDWTIILILQTPKAKIYKNSKTTYADWADKNGFKWMNIKDL